MIEWVYAAGGLLVGLGIGRILRSSRAKDAAPKPLAAPVIEPPPVRVPPSPTPSQVTAAGEALSTPEPEIDGGELVAPPHLIRLLGQALREPLRVLRRTDGVPDAAVAQLERVVWQTRMLISRARPMQAKPTSPISLLQEAAEDVALLRDGAVGASWSLLNRQPVHVDPERMRGAFREILDAGAQAAGSGGRVGIKILGSDEPGYPVKIEIEIGRRGSETDPLALSVVRHLVESQGGRLEVDANITRILLRNSAPEELEDHETA